MTNLDCLAGWIPGGMLGSHQVYCGEELHGVSAVPVVRGAAAFLGKLGQVAVELLPESTPHCPRPPVGDSGMST